MSRPRFRLRTLLILLVAASVLLAWLIALRKGAQSIGLILPADAVYLTLDPPRNDLEAVSLFAVHDGQTTPVRPYLWMLTWSTIDEMVELSATGKRERNQPADWTYGDDYLLVGRDPDGGWHRWSFPAAGNVRVVWYPTGRDASVRVPDDAEADVPTRDELIALGVHEWTIDDAW